jgi:hypothetical protein
MSCSGTPTYDSDVVRKVDMPVNTTYTNTTGGWSDGGVTPTTNSTIKVARFGNIVSILVGSFSHTMNTTFDNITWYIGGSTVGTLTSEYRPSEIIRIPIIITYDGTVLTGVFYVDTSGLLRIYGANFVAGKSISANSTCLSWNVL